MKKILLTSIAVLGASMITFAQKDTTIKTPVIKDTIKSKQTGMVFSIENMIAFGPLTDSTKKVSPKPDTLKSGSIEFKSVNYYALLSPPTDSTKTKPAIKSDTTTKPVDKRTGAIQMDKSLLKNETLEA